MRGIGGNHATGKIARSAAYIRFGQKAFAFHLAIDRRRGRKLQVHSQAGCKGVGQFDRVLLLAGGRQLGDVFPGALSLSSAVQR